MALKVFIHFGITKRDMAWNTSIAVLSMAAANKFDFKMREVYDDIEQSDEDCVLSGRSDYKPPPPATYEESPRDLIQAPDIRHAHVNKTRKSRRRHHRKDLNYELKRFGNFRRAETTLRDCLWEGQDNCKPVSYTYDVKMDTPPPTQLKSNRLTRPLHDWTTKIFKLTRTTPFRLSFNEECDYLAYYCMKAYQTGRLCARTFYYIYHTFINYCMLDYVNCRERHEIWQVIHMGDCFSVKPLASYNQYPYHNDYFLDQYYIVEENSMLV